MTDLRIKDGPIQLTHIEGHATALLTVRGKDHNLDLAELRELASACLTAVYAIEHKDDPDPSKWGPSSNPRAGG